MLLWSIQKRVNALSCLIRRLESFLQLITSLSMLHFLASIFTILFCGTLFFLAFRRSKPKLSGISFKPQMNIWMQMTKEQRFSFLHRENVSTMQRKEQLLGEIRKEYNDMIAKNIEE